MKQLCMSCNRTKSESACRDFVSRSKRGLHPKQTVVDTDSPQASWPLCCLAKGLDCLYGFWVKDA